MDGIQITWLALNLKANVTRYLYLQLEIYLQVTEMDGTLEVHELFGFTGLSEVLESYENSNQSNHRKYNNIPTLTLVAAFQLYAVPKV